MIDEKLKTLNAEMILRGFSKRTISSYLYWNSEFLKWIKKDARAVSNSDINSYLLHLNSKNFEPNTLHLCVACLNFYYCIVLRRRFTLHYPKKPKLLPVVLSKEEILRMIQVTTNKKHRLLIEILYSSGLRVSEVVKLKWNDVDPERKVLFISQGKGRKDRYTLLSEKVISELRLFPRVSEYIFYSDINLKQHITIRTAQQILKSAGKKAKIKKNVFCHSLRSSFATHLTESGTDIHYIQKLLGHSDVKTTEGYLRVADKSVFSIKSPLD